MLEGIRVLDVATLAAAPLAATYLGEFGADVIKVEQPDGGDPIRSWGNQRRRRRADVEVVVAQQEIDHAQPAASPKARRCCAGWSSTPTW